MQFCNNPFFLISNKNLPIEKHTNDIKERSYLLIGRMPSNIESFLNAVEKKRNLIEAIIAPAEILQNFPNFNHVICEEALKAWAFLASRNFPNKPKHIIAVTGTDGKTSTCWFIAQMLQLLGHNSILVSTIGNFVNGKKICDNINTTPDSLDLHKALHDFTLEYGTDSFAIIETSSIAVDWHRIDYLDLDIAIWTNFSPEHLDFYSTLELYFTSKMQLGNLSKQFFAHNSIQQNKFPTYGHELLNYEQKEQLHLHFKFRENCIEREYSTSANIIGEFQAINILSAITALHALSHEFFPINKLIDCIPKLTAPAGRMTRIGNVIIDFAHTPAALQEAITTIRKLKPEKLIVIMGCGGNRDKAKRPLIGQIMAEMADVAIITNDNPRNEDPKTIAAEIQGTRNLIIELDRKRATELGISMLRDNDILLIAGKGDERFQIINDVFNEYNDESIVRELLNVKIS